MIGFLLLILLLHYGTVVVGLEGLVNVLGSFELLLEQDITKSLPLLAGDEVVLEELVHEGLINSQLHLLVQVVLLLPEGCLHLLDVGICIFVCQGEQDGPEEAILRECLILPIWVREVLKNRRALLHDVIVHLPDIKLLRSGW